MKVSDFIISCLETEKVEYVFGIVGKETIDLADSLSKSTQIQFVNVRHEQGAAFMADVYGRLAGKAGVCFSTLGPGATNLMTGIASAQLDHSPLVALIGQADVARNHPESHQYLDIVTLTEPVTKWNTQIMNSQTVHVTIRNAFRMATMEKPGAVAVVLPENFLTQQISAKPLPVQPLPQTVPAVETIEAARTRIQNSRKPFLLVGNGVIREDATQELQALIDTLQAPVAHSFMAKGILPKEHSFNYFTFGFAEKDEVIAGTQECDLIISIGLDLVESPTKNWNDRKMPVLHIDTLPAEVNEYYPVEIECVGNIKKTLQSLNQLGLPTKSWVPAGNLKEKIMTAHQISDAQSKPSGSPLSIEQILYCIEAVAAENTILISDVGAHKVSIARTYQPKQPNRVIISNGLASMGIALPGSIGAKLACPDDPVICITGDGGAVLNIAELETAKRLGLSFMIIVLNDSMLKLEVQQMNKRFGESYGVTYKNPDFVQLAESFGIKGKKVKTIEEFEVVLKENLHRQEEIVLVEVVMPN
ncbi:acetolactate synthase large subunit [Bacillus sp. FJAT-29814]|uniref:acetolactate synthase large subunit n=1 Tax=Bacillus sp. FJAT-29814 TaxID=1729688 RepID=UPI0008335B68|nr:acetolactate synthase large subunit [Bacillus sp. FJAT-29814]